MDVKCDHLARRRCFESMKDLVMLCLLAHEYDDGSLMGQPGFDFHLLAPIIFAAHVFDSKTCIALEAACRHGTRELFFQLVWEGRALYPWLTVVATDYNDPVKLKFLLDNGVYITDDCIYDRAATIGADECFKLVIEASEIGRAPRIRDFSLTRPIMAHRIELCKWLFIDKKIPVPKNVLLMDTGTFVVSEGNRDMLQIMHGAGVLFDIRALHMAAWKLNVACLAALIYWKTPGSEEYGEFFVALAEAHELYQANGKLPTGIVLPKLPEKPANFVFMPKTTCVSGSLVDLCKTRRD